MGTNKLDDDQLADWSSHGTTQDGLAKPDVLAPGAHMVSDAGAGQRLRVAVPGLRPRRPVLPGRRHLDGGRVVSGIVADLIDAPSRLEAQPGQGRDPATMRNVKGLGAEIDADYAMGADSRRAGLQRRPHAEHAARPGHRPDRLQPRRLEPRGLERRRRGAAGRLEPRGLELDLRLRPTADDDAAAADPSRAGWRFRSH